MGGGGGEAGAEVEGERLEAGARHDRGPAGAGRRLVAIDHLADPVDLTREVELMDAVAGAGPVHRLAVAGVRADQVGHHPAQLGRVAVDVGIAEGDLQGRLVVQRSPGRLTVEDLSATLPVNIAGLFYAPALFFAPTGTLELRSERLSLARDALAGEVRAQWRGAGGRFTGSKSLGDYRIDLNGEGERASLRLSTVSGDLNLSGRGEWRVSGNGELRFTGAAQPQGDAARLEPLLRAIGPDRGGGRRDLRFNTQMPLARLLGL